MTNSVMQVIPLVSPTDEPQGRALWVWCPGCDEAHSPTVAGVGGDLPSGPCWDWDGNFDAPTISPSLLVNGVQWAVADPFHKPSHMAPAGGAIICHSFIRAGQWQFLSDCTHRFAGQTVPMVLLPDWLVSP